MMDADDRLYRARIQGVGDGSADQQRARQSVLRIRSPSRSASVDRPRQRALRERHDPLNVIA